jgi:hypothetical protein
MPNPTPAVRPSRPDPWDLLALRRFGQQFREPPGLIAAVGHLLVACRAGHPERIRLALGDLERLVWRLADRLER